MTYSTTYQVLVPLLREKLRGQVTVMGMEAGKQLEFTDDMLNDFAVIFTVGMLNEQPMSQAFAVAYQTIFAIQREE